MGILNSILVYDARIFLEKIRHERAIQVYNIV